MNNFNDLFHADVPQHSCVVFTDPECPAIVLQGMLNTIADNAKGLLECLDETEGCMHGMSQAWKKTSSTRKFSCI